MRRDKRLTRLPNPGLELARLRVLVTGKRGAAQTDTGCFSPAGRAIYSAIRDTDPSVLSREDVQERALSLHQSPGADEEAILELLEKVYSGTSSKPADDLVRDEVDRSMVFDLINETASMIGPDGKVDRGRLQAILAHGTNGHHELRPIGDDPEEESVIRVPLKEFPYLTKISRGGLCGIWTIVGDTGYGKSTLAAQIACDVAIRHGIPTLYYDIDRGVPDLRERLERHTFRLDPQKYEQVKSKIYRRTSLDTLWEDVQHVPAPRIVVIDTIQVLPVGNRGLRESISDWLTRLRELLDQGSYVIATSQKSRAEYEQASMRSARESSAIEDSSSLLLVMHGQPGSEVVPAKIVKNRYGPCGELFLARDRDPNDSNELTSYLYRFTERLAPTGAVNTFDEHESAHDTAEIKEARRLDAEAWGKGS